MQLKSIWVTLAMLATPAAWAQAPQKTVHDVQLDSGITLADWLSLPAQKAAEPSLGVGAQAASYVQRYGPFRELLDVVRRAAAAKLYADTGMTADNAAQRLAAVELARKQLGDWPNLLWAQARAHVTLLDNTRARKALVAWVGVVPANEPKRPQIVDLLVNSEQDVTLVTLWHQRQSRADVEGQDQMRREDRRVREACDLGATDVLEVGSTSGTLRQCGTGLDWTQRDSRTNVNWSQAQAYCQGQGDGWSLPTVAQLQSLYKSSLPGVSCGSYTCKVSNQFNLSSAYGWYWSSDSDGSSRAWVVSLYLGHRNSMRVGDSDSDLRALCVRRL